MLIDLSKTKFNFVLLLEVNEVKVLSIGLACHHFIGFGATAICATFQIEFISKHLWLHQLYSVLHQA